MMETDIIQTDVLKWTGWKLSKEKKKFVLRGVIIISDIRMMSP